ncbi:hypothetical protein ACA910_014492 [Epithemia clementina (nom. ined.)]
MQNQALFASSSMANGHAQQEDFDFNEVFAEYFSNEFDIDPLNAYTSSMANYSSGGGGNMLTAAQAHAAALAAQNKNANATPVATPSSDAAAAAAPVTTSAGTTTTTAGSDEGSSSGGNTNNTINGGSSGTTTTTKKGFHLPTGGIKTVFHYGSSRPLSGVPPKKRSKSDEEQQQQQQPQPLVVNAQMPTLLAPNSAHGGHVAALALAHQQAAAAAQLQQQQLQDKKPPTAAAAPSNQPHDPQQLLCQQQDPQTQQQIAALQQFGIQAQQLQEQQQQQLSSAVLAVNAAAPGPATTAADKAATTTAPRVALPVGIGIRLGGLGGIAPATAQANARPPILQAQYAAGMWAAAAGGVHLAGQAHPGGLLLPGGGLGMGGLGLLGVGGAPNEQAAAERRQRNREHAKRSRVRKKFMLESMQEQVQSLQIENQNLRMLVQEHIPEHAVAIIAECCTTSPLFAEPSDYGGEGGSKGEPVPLGKSDFSLMESLTSGQRCFVLSDPKLPDNPIVFASSGFYEMTGYTAKETLGRNCRFLQGPGTDPRAVDVIRKAIVSGADATICLLNYKADGTPFWNQFFIAALRDSDNCIVNYVGVQCEVEPEQGDSGVEEKVNEVLPLGNRSDDGNEDGENPDD